MLHTMQTLGFFCVLSILFYAVQRQALRSAPNLTAQLAPYLADPSIVQPIRQLGPVLISFRLNTDERLTDVRVYTNNQTFNTAVVQRLTGRKISSTGLPHQRTQWIRMRFNPTEKNPS